MANRPSGRERILLVDRSGILESRLAETISRRGFDTQTVDSAAACLQAVSEREVVAVVTEFELADIDGIRLLRSIRVSAPNLPVLLWPRDGSEQLASEAIAAGASGYVPDESSPETVVSRLSDAIDRSNLAGEGESHGRYRHLIEMSPAAINVFDERGESIWANEAALDLLGLDDREELIGRSIFEFIHPDDHDLAREEMESVIEEQESTGPTQMKLRPPDGEVRHILVSTAVGQFLGSEVGQAIVVDLTGRVERERQMSMLEQWLRHNIRNEMNVIQGIADDLVAGRAADPAESGRRIRAHASHLLEQADQERTVIDILTSPPNLVDVDLAERIAAELDGWRAAHPAADIEVESDGTVRAETTPEITDAVGELVENAVVHNDADAPTVRVELEEADDRCRIRVHDDGPGIPETEERSLLEGEVDQLHHGSGVGLVLAYWVARRSGGRLEFGERDGAGTTVTITLPRSSGR